MTRPRLGWIACWLFTLPLAATVEGSPPFDSVIDVSSPLAPVKLDFELADGAAWDGDRLLVPDVKAKRLYAFSSRIKTDGGWQVLLPQAGAISGTFFQLGTLYLSNNGDSSIQTLVDRQPQTLVKFADGAKPNDLVVSRHGDVYATITSTGEVRRVRPDGIVSVVLTGLETPNGITMSPSGDRLYVSQSKSGQLIQADIQADATWGNARPFAQLPQASDGFKGDGMCVDRAGNVYCCGAQAVVIWDRDGKQLATLKTPERPINCTFGGSDARTLFISTFGGLYSQRMNAYGVSPNPPLRGPQAAAAGARPTTALTDRTQITLDVIAATEGPRQLLMDIVSPRNTDRPLPAIVLVHGGGWTKGDKTKFRSLAISLADRGYVVAAIEYRLGFEAKFPAAIHDCNAATRFLRANAVSFQIDPDRIGAVGGSAGGHLVALMATGSDNAFLQGSGGNPEQSSKLKAAVVMAGPMPIASGSVAERSHDRAQPSNAVDWLGATIDEAPELYRQADAYLQITADDPPILFIRGSLDNPGADQPSLERLQEVGVATKQVIHTGAKHGHWNQAAWIDRVTDDIDAFFQQHL